MEERFREDRRQEHQAYQDAVREEAAVPDLARILEEEQDSQQHQVDQGEGGLGPERTRAAEPDPARDGRQGRRLVQDARLVVVHALRTAAAEAPGAVAPAQTVGRDHGARRGLGDHPKQASVGESKVAADSSRQLSRSHRCGVEGVAMSVVL